MVVSANTRPCQPLIIVRTCPFPDVTAMALPLISTSKIIFLIVFVMQQGQKPALKGFHQTLPVCIVKTLMPYSQFSAEKFQFNLADKSRFSSCGEATTDDEWDDKLTNVVFL